MFTISRLFSKENDIDDQGQYIKVASLIEAGSVLDRRKPANDRRGIMDRRMRLRDSFSGEEKRCHSDRRSIASRREADLAEKEVEEIVKAEIEQPQKAKNKDLIDSTKKQTADKNVIDITIVEDQNLSEVEVLIRDQVEIMTCMSDLSKQAKVNNFEGIDEKIRNISFKLKSIKCEEEKLLYLSFDRKEKILCNNSEKPVTEVLEYIHGASDKAIEFLDRYYSGVTAASVGFFLLDMNIVQNELSQVLDKKKQNLYPMYEGA